MFNYNHLRYFWAVAHEGNLTRAARKLHVSQSAVSVQIQKLEDELGQRLFERRGRQLLLSEAGRIALEHADGIFSLGDALLGTLKEVSCGRGRVLRVGSLATLSRNFQLTFLQPALQRHDVAVELRSGNLDMLLPLLIEHRIDVLLTHTLPPSDGATRWVPHAIASQPVALVGHPRRLRQRRRLRTLLTHEPLVVPPPASSIRLGFDALMDRMGLHPSIIAEVDDMAMLRLLARDDVGLAVVPPIVVKDELDSGILLEVEQLASLQETFFAITVPRRFPNPLLATLLRAAADALPEQS